MALTFVGPAASGAPGGGGAEVASADGCGAAPVRMDQECCVAGPAATSWDWVRFARGFVARWVDDDFTWGGVPLGELVGRVEVDIPGEPTMVVADRGGGAAPGEPSGAGDVEAMLGDWCHEVWSAVAGSWVLEGRWLHPDTAMADPVALYRSAPLVIGTRDRYDPASPRRFDATKMSWSHDLGCIEFPTHSLYRVVQWAAEGHEAAVIAARVAVASVVDAAVHEAMEMFQREAGSPVFDPHQMGWPEHDVRTTFRASAA